MLTMTRRVTFSAGKIDWIPGDSGRAAPPEPYGHNYTLDVTVSGSIDPVTGIIVNIKEIDHVVRAYIVDRFDRKLIHNQAPEFCGRPATAETLAAWIAQTLRTVLPRQVALTRVRLEETPLTTAEWQEQSMSSVENGAPRRGEMQATRSYEFAASHRLHSPHLSDEENRELFGKCNYPNGHGHNYILEVTIAGPVDPVSGRIMDPGELDQIVHREVVDRYDHRHLNYDIPEFHNLVPSTEVVTRTIWDRLAGVVPPPARLVSVLIRETARNSFEYRGEA